jgi:Tol biopolymer transport system component
MLIMVYNGNLDIARIDDDGSNFIALTSDASSERDAAWAPDGKRIVFASDAFAESHPSLYAMNDDGTGITRLTYAPADGADGAPVGFAAGVVFQRFDPVNGYAIFLLSTEGAVTQLTSGPGDRVPSPSPKGKSVAFARANDIYVLDLGTGGLTNVTNTPNCAEMSAAYSPSGKQIAFWRAACGDIQGGIFVMDADGTYVTRLTTNTIATTDEDPRWSPDGKRIAFTRVSDHAEIYSMSADGTNLTLLPLDPTSGTHLTAWARY